MRPRPIGVALAAAWVAALAVAPSASASDVGGAAAGTSRTLAGAIAAAPNHTCAIVDGHVTCWGSDTFGQLGNGVTTGDVVSPGQPVVFDRAHAAVQITAGGNHTCALLEDDSVWCWGANQSGEAGVGFTSTAIDRPAEVTFADGRVPVSIAAGSLSTCALFTDGQVTCWGGDGAGQLGNGPSAGIVTAPQQPIALPDGRSAVAITASSVSACALLDDGRVTCWGSDVDGQLGNGPSVTANVDAPPPPIALPAGTSAIAVTLGARHACALLHDGTLSC